MCNDQTEKIESNAVLKQSSKSMARKSGKEKCRFLLRMHLSWTGAGLWKNQHGSWSQKKILPKVKRAWPEQRCVHNYWSALCENRVFFTRTFVVPLVEAVKNSFAHRNLPLYLSKFLIRPNTSSPMKDHFSYVWHWSVYF